MQWQSMTCECSPKDVLPVHCREPRDEVVLGRITNRPMAAKDSGPVDGSADELRELLERSKETAVARVRFPSEPMR